MYQHPQVPWVTIQPLGNGCAVATDTRRGTQAQVCSDLQLHEFAAYAAAAPGRMGAGDVVAGVTNRLGIKKCAPCAARQAAMNRMFPSVFRR